MKKNMLPGGASFQTTAIKKAIELSYYVIDVEYLPQHTVREIYPPGVG